MATNIQIVDYSDEYKDKWDQFIINQSINGNILHTKRFLDYHPAKRFEDASILFFNGTNIVAVIPANRIENDNSKQFVSHQGSTFGGLIIGKQYCKINYLDAIMESFNSYLIEKNYNRVILKLSNDIFGKHDSSLIDYYLFKDGYVDSQEVGFYIDFSEYPEDIISAFSSSRRRDYRYSLKRKLIFKELEKEDEIKLFYEVLCDNYRKFEKNPVHSYEELIDFKYHRLCDETSFYGVFDNEELIAGGMIFKFEKKVFHTQYLAVRQDKKDIFANEFLYTNLITEAKNNGFGMISFGTSTLDGGKVLNKPLALFKEGFGTKTYINRTYVKNIEK